MSVYWLPRRTAHSRIPWYHRISLSELPSQPKCTTFPHATYCPQTIHRIYSACAFYQLTLLCGSQSDRKTLFARYIFGSPHSWWSVSQPVARPIDWVRSQSISCALYSILRLTKQDSDHHWCVKDTVTKGAVCAAEMMTSENFFTKANSCTFATTGSRQTWL